jgi:hypothetical protein
MIKHSIEPGWRSIENAAAAGSIVPMNSIVMPNSTGASLIRLQILLLLLMVWVVCKLEQLERGVCAVIVLVG